MVGKVEGDSRMKWEKSEVGGRREGGGGGEEEGGREEEEIERSGRLRWRRIRRWEQNGMEGDGEGEG